VTAAVATDRLTRSFDGRPAVADLTITIPRGTIFGLLGPNGAGKTTTIRLLLALLEPTSGSARVLGFDTRTEGDAIRARTGALLEHTGLYERLTASDNLEFYARASLVPPVDRRERIRDVLNSLGLYDRRDEMVGKWSRGMKQKLAVARALIHRPELLFLDEPTNGLDPIAAASLRSDLRQLADRSGVTVFLTTHNLVEAEQLCQTVAIINSGRLLALGSADELSAGGRRRTLDEAFRELVQEAQ
jgi:ABC-2 type transport system ATP-binding protein